MVQYIFTPWKDREELLRVRQQFYPGLATAATARQTATTASITAGDIIATTHQQQHQQHAAHTERQHAVDRVSMWMQRGGCPHMVESTALLVAAMLSDETASSSPSPTTSGASVSSYAVRAAYSAAFSRFVTGLLDSHQDKQHKLSMYSVARTIGLPATFVELRHQATHEQLPSLTRLRSGAAAALVWIWDYYWKHLSIAEEGQPPADVDAAGMNDRACRAGLARLLEANGGEQGELEKDTLRQLLRRWGRDSVLRALDELGDEAVWSQDHALVVRTLRLSREVLVDGRDQPGSESSGTDDEGEGRSSTSDAAGKGAVKVDLELLQAELEQARQDLKDLEAQEEERQRRRRADTHATQSGNPGDESSGWSRYNGVWRPRPIGMG